MLTYFCRTDSCIVAMENIGFTFSYSTIKMLYWMCKEADLKLTWHQIEHAVRRNFGGLEQFDPLRVFRNKVIMPPVTDLSHFPQQVCMDGRLL